MIEIHPIKPTQIADAKRIIYEEAQIIFRWDKNLEELIQQFEKEGMLSDIDNFQTYYFDNRGTFLVATHKNRVIGTGAIHRIRDDVCELKRLWLSAEYQGKGIGYRIFRELIVFARSKGYKKMWLETDCMQERAIRFYESAGFYRIQSYNDRNSDVYMEMNI